MYVLTPTKTIGLTLKLVIEGDEELAHDLLHTLPSDLAIEGADLSNLRVRVGNREVEPARIWVQREDVSIEEEDEFLENS